MPDISYYRDIGHAAMAADICAIARAERDEGMAQALHHAERVEPSWGDRAFDFLHDYAMNHREFISEDVSDASIEQGFPQPPTLRAWGAVYHRAVREHVIVMTGVGRSRRRHASVCPLWTSKVKP